MELILADKNGNDIRLLSFKKADFDIGNENNFEIVIALDDWKNDIESGCRIYEADTENGGIVGGIKTDTEYAEITVMGYTWRGLLAKKIIEPPAGSAYRKVSGDVNAVISSMLNSADFSNIITGVDTYAGVSVSNYQFNRYVTLLDGLKSMLLSVGHKLLIKATENATVQICAVPVVDYSDKIEMSQNYGVNFIIEKKADVVNHLICLGAGELENREILHLYLQKDGSIGKLPYYTGINEIAETCDFSNSEDLEADGIEHFKELIANTALTVNVIELDIDVGIGDYIGGRDYITGMKISKPLASKIITVGENISIEYNLEE